MVKWLGAVAAFLCVLAAAPQAKKKPKPAELEIVEIHAVRNGEKVQIDGRVRNTGDIRAQEVQLIFYFVAPDKKTVSTRRGPLESPDIQPGEQAVFTLESPAPVRAAFVRLEAVAKGERFLKLSNDGPFPVE